MKWLLVLACALLGSQAAEQEEQTVHVCRPETVDASQVVENDLNKRWYVFVTERRTYDQAINFCQIEKGRLVNIDSAAMQEFVERRIIHKYQPPAGYEAADEKTWGREFDPNIWLGATMDPDRTWRFDQYQTIRTSSKQVILQYFNWNDATTKRLVEDQNYILTDVCLFGRLRKEESGVYSLPWLYHTQCTSINGHKHPFICEYEGYDCVDVPMANWLITIIVLAVFVCCGFVSCATYCLWDKIHTSYNVLQV